MTEAAQMDIEEVAPVKTKAKKGEVVKLEKAATPAPVPATSDTAAILAMAERLMVDPSVSVERANQALDFALRLKSEAAQQAYFEAKAAFKAAVPAIIKDKENKQYGSTYATIGNVVNTANETLSKFGLDASWTFEQGERIAVTCTLRHVLGHSERVSLSGPPDTSGSKNPMQQIKSTLTYLKLATFEGVTGIATKEGNVDDDGNGATGDGPISEEQLAELIAIADDVGADKAKFCKFAKVESFADIYKSKFDKAKATLKNYGRQQ